ncbi:MAG TPA: hypothetical protein VGG01_16580 [Xanthobacteraceae bacterium]
MAPRVERALKCPSAQPGMGDTQVLGVVSRDAETPRLAYLDQPMAATPDIIEMAAPVAVSEIFRLSARCEESKCMHFDGAKCQLAVRIANLLPEAVDTLPACNIRADCRWFRQEGRAACLRCPQIVTGNAEADDLLQRVAGMPHPRAALPHQANPAEGRITSAHAAPTGQETPQV